MIQMMIGIDCDGDSPPDEDPRVEGDAANFKLRAWMFSGECKFFGDISTHEVYLPRIPLEVERMIIFANISVRNVGNACCIDIRGYLVGKGASCNVWGAWLNRRLSWTPVSDIALNKD